MDEVCGQYADRAILSGMPRPPFWLPDGLALLAGDCPLPLTTPFTGPEAVAYGVSPKTLRTLVRRGLVREVVRGAYAVAQLPDTLDTRAAALRLVVGQGAVVTDRTAAWLHGIDVLPRSAVHEAAPLDVFSIHESRLRRPQVNSGIRDLAESDLGCVDGVLVTTPARTALDLGRLLHRYDAIGALDAFLRLGVPRDELEGQLSRFKGFRGVIQLRELVLLADPRAESMPESALRLHANDGGIELVPQVWVEGMFRLDLALPALKYGAEYHGVAFHSSDDQRRSDSERSEFLVEAGWVIDDFWRDDVYGSHAHPAAVLLSGVDRARRQLGRWQHPSLGL